jgi:hypothetical protein
MATMLLVLRTLQELRWIEVVVLGLTLMAGLGAALGACQHAQREKRSGLLLVGIAVLFGLASAVLSALGSLFVAVALLVLVSALLGIMVELPRATDLNRLALVTAFVLISGLLVGAIAIGLWGVIPRRPTVTVVPYTLPDGVPMVPPSLPFRESHPGATRLLTPHGVVRPPGRD